MRLLQFYRSCSLASSQLRAFHKIWLRRPLPVRLAALAAGSLNRSLELVWVYMLIAPEEFRLAAPRLRPQSLT
jgi:hypothetical protein